MHGQANYTTQVEQGPYAPPPAFQQRPAATAPPPASHHGPPPPRPQVIQQGPPSFHFTPGILPYQHAQPSVLHQGPLVPGVSGGVSSAQSYGSHPQPPQVHVSTQTSHAYRTSEQQCSPWIQNVHQVPPTAPRPGPSAYPLPSSQGHTFERVPPHQATSHAPQPPPPPYSSSSSFLTSDPFGSSVFAMQQPSYLQSMRPLPPPPPRPPPPPLSSPPGVPPLPQSSPPSDVLSKSDGNRCLKVDQIEVPSQHTEKSEPKVESVDAVAHSPTDSDMDMEDDITHPDEEKQNCLFNHSDDAHASISEEDCAKENKGFQPIEGRKLPKLALEGNSLLAGVSVTKGQIGGSEYVSDCDFAVTRKVSAEANNSGMIENVQTEHPLVVNADGSSSQLKNFMQPSMGVVCAETGYGELSGELKEGTNPVKLLQGYASDTTLENEDENLVGDVSPPSTNDRSPHFDAEKGCIGSEHRREALLESNEPILSKSVTESPKKVMEADGLSFVAGKVDEFSDKSHRGQESISLGTSSAPEPKGFSGNSNANIGLDGAIVHKAEMKCNSTKLNVDEFGRLIREGVSDSDSNDSSHQTKRHARRARKRSRSRNRSRSPHDRRRRSPWRRKERRGRSRSLSPKRRRGRSRSPISRRDSEFSGDKLKRGKGLPPECFDFLRGKCYRGATCRYSHHESDKSEGMRYNRGKQQYRGTPPDFRSHDFRESKAFPDKEVKDMLPLRMPILKEVEDAKEQPVNATNHSPEKLNSLGSVSLLVAGAGSNHSAYSAHGMPLRKENSLVSESPAQFSDNVPQIVDQKDKRTGDSLISESPSFVQASAASTHLPGNKPDAKQDPTDPKHGFTSELHSVGSPVMKSYSTEEIPSESLKELLPANSNHPSQLTLPLPLVSSVMSAPCPQSIPQGYNIMPPSARMQMIPPYQAPAGYQHSNFPALLNSLSNSFLPPPPPPRSHLSVSVSTEEHKIPSQNVQLSSVPPGDGLSSYSSMRAQPTELPNQYQSARYQGYPVAREPGQMLHNINDTGSSSLSVSNLTSQQGGPHIMGEDRFTGHPIQGINPLQSFSQAQPNSLLMQSPLKGMHSSLRGGLPSESSTHCRPYLEQASHGLQYSSGISAQLAESGKVSSSMTRITPDLLERSQPSHMGDYVGSRIHNHFNPYASTFDLPLSSKFSSDALIQESDATDSTKYGPPVGLSSAPVNVPKIGTGGSKNMNSSWSSGLPAESVLPRPGGDQYDPLFDSIEPASTSFSRADRLKHESTGDSDNLMGFSGSGRVLNMDGIKQEGGAAVSANDFPQNEECGETADAEIGAVLTGSSSNPNDTADMNAGEIEIDQVKVSGKKKKGKDSRSMKLFKISVATFVKDVLKPSWRQGNMSKEAFKTIVKKTVDKVSGAMKSRKIPKSQAKINHYIDSSRGKLTKLVMGYVDKYVKA